MIRRKDDFPERSPPGSACRHAALLLSLREGRNLLFAEVAEPQSIQVSCSRGFSLRWFLLLSAFALTCICAFAQDNYEIQVYGSETVAPKNTMVELHSNFTFEGSKTLIDGQEPTNHAEHETLEITQRITPWFETGFYVFTSAKAGYGWQYVGDHIRPRVRAPESWHWPVGVSLSTEFGYARPEFTTGPWSLELRPIVDQKAGRLYWAVNPTVDKSFSGLDSKRGWEFNPNVKVSWDLNPKIAAGLEYYGGVGPVVKWDSIDQQSQQFIPAIDLNLSEKWEFNFGVGVGVTRSTDHLIVKMILGRKLTWGRSTKEATGGTTTPEKLSPISQQ